MVPGKARRRPLVGCAAAEASRDARGTGTVPAGFPLPIVLGIDPGTFLVGYGAIVASGRGPRLLAAGDIRPPRRGSLPERLAAIRAELDALLSRLRPSVVVVEQAYTARNVQSALRIGEGRGVVMACAAAFGAEVVQYPPATARKALVGCGSASKQQVARMVVEVLRLAVPLATLDASDALALALAYERKRSSLLAAPAGGRPRSANGVRR